MAILKSKDIRKMSQKEIAGKISELKLELTRANVTANKANSKTKEIKRTISRLMTVQNMQKFDKAFNKTSKNLEGELKKK